METLKPSLKERREELKLKREELKIHQETLELQDKQTTALLAQLQKLKSMQRMDVIREGLLANGVNFLTGDIAQNPERDFNNAMKTYLNAVKTLDTLESDKLS
jgi:hypothetical protein